MPTQKIKVSEKEIQKAIIQYLQILENKGKCYFIRANSFAGAIKRKNGSTGWIKNNKVGCPDIVCCANGRFIGLEVKNEKGKMSANQEEAKALIEKVGGSYYVVRSINDVQEVIPF